MGEERCGARLSSRRVYESANVILVRPPTCQLGRGHKGVHRTDAGEMWAESWCEGKDGGEDG